MTIWVSDRSRWRTSESTSGTAGKAVSTVSVRWASVYCRLRRSTMRGLNTCFTATEYGRPNAGSSIAAVRISVAAHGRTTGRSRSNVPMSGTLSEMAQANAPGTPV